MTFLVGICLVAFIGCIVYLKENWSIAQVKTKIIVIVVAIAVFIGFFAALAGFLSDEMSRPKRNGFYGSDGEYHPYISEFGDDVNDWMEDNW